MNKLVSESLYEYNRLNEEEHLDEGLFSNPVKIWKKIDKSNVEQIKKFAKGLVTGVNSQAIERVKKNIDNDKITLEMLLSALEEGMKNNFKGGTVRAGKDKIGNIVVKWVPVKLASQTAQNTISGTGSA